jgi:hypothetical protein
MKSCTNCLQFSWCGWWFMIGPHLERVTGKQIQADNLAAICPKYQPKEATQ